MAIEQLKRKDQRAQVWKNGKGKTLELAIFPTEADFRSDPFLWRLSSAQIVESGLFSKFPGYERFLTLLDGSSITFQIKGCVEKLKLGEVKFYSGSEEVSVELNSAQSLTDLNLIFNKEMVKASFHVVKLSHKSARSFELEGRTCFLVGVAQPVQVSFYPGKETAKLQIGDAIRLEPSLPDQVIFLEPLKEKVEAWVVLIELSY